MAYLGESYMGRHFTTLPIFLGGGGVDYFQEGGACSCIYIN